MYREILATIPELESRPKLAIPDRT